MFTRQPRYRERCEDQGFRIADGYDDHADTFAEIKKVLAVHDDGTVPCNNDLLAENFIDDGEKVWLIDYDYSGNNDACFELGNSWAECRLDDEHLEELVDGVLRRPRAGEGGACPAPGGGLAVRLVVVGVHPERRQPARLRLLGMGDGALRVGGRGDGAARLPAAARGRRR